MRFDTVIIGAGISGCVMAERLATQKDQNVLIIEKRDHIAGNMYDYYNDAGVLIHKYGPHFFRTDKEEIWGYLGAFTDWHMYEHKVKTSVEDKLVPFPINLDTYNMIHDTDLSVPQFQEQLKTYKFTDDPQNAEEAIINQVGEKMYELFFKNYTIKQWGRSPKDLHADTVKRVPVRLDREDRYQLAKYQGLPLHGYTRLFENLIKDQKIKLILKTDYKDIISSIDYDNMIYTGPLDYYFDYKYGRLEYRSLKFEEKTFDCSSYQGAAVINYPNDHDYTRVSEYKKMTGQVHHKTSVHFEYPLEYQEGISDPYYPILNKKNSDIKEMYLADCKKLANVHFLGRLAEYRYYAMDDAVEAALALYKQVWQ